MGGGTNNLFRRGGDSTPKRVFNLRSLGDGSSVNATTPLCNRFWAVTIHCLFAIGFKCALFAFHMAMDMCRFNKLRSPGFNPPSMLRTPYCPGMVMKLIPHPLP